jgi:hypothetical protein
MQASNKYVCHMQASHTNKTKKNSPTWTAHETFTSAIKLSHTNKTKKNSPTWTAHETFTSAIKLGSSSICHLHNSKKPINFHLHERHRKLVLETQTRLILESYTSNHDQQPQTSRTHPSATSLQAIVHPSMSPPAPLFPCAALPPGHHQLCFSLTPQHHGHVHFYPTRAPQQPVDCSMYALARHWSDEAHLQHHNNRTISLLLKLNATSYYLRNINSILLFQRQIWTAQMYKHERDGLTDLHHTPFIVHW